MNIRVRKSMLNGTVKAIASKSYAHRLLIGAALADKGTYIKCEETSRDIEATAHCLSSLGADIHRDAGGFHVTPVQMAQFTQPAQRDNTPGVLNDNGQKASPYILDCGESGSTLRMLLPVVCGIGANAAFHMQGRLPVRPLSPLDEELTAHGCRLSGQGSSPLLCEGRLAAGTYTLPGNVSSQFISGLLLALPLLSGESVIRVTGDIESKPYIDMTIDALSLYGIDVQSESGRYIIKEESKYHSPDSVTVEGDWSNAAFWLSAGAIGRKRITCTNLNLKSKQGDRQIAALLSRFGAEVCYGENSVSVSPGVLRGTEINARNIPDLVPVLAAVAAAAEGKTVITGAKRLRIKESDRLQSVTQMLSNLGADIEEMEDGLVITGGKALRGGTVSSFGDHRIAMAAAVVSTACEGDVRILNADAADKSYPGFFRDFAALGGAFEVESGEDNGEKSEEEKRCHHNMGKI